MYKLSSKSKTLAEYLNENGYHCEGNTIRLSLVPKRGFDKVLQHNEEKDNLISLHKDEISKIHEKSKSSGNPFFLYLHYSKIHQSIFESVLKKYTDFSEDYFNNKENNLLAYDKYLEASSEYSKEIVEHVNNLGLSENTLVMIVSDHGMGVGEKIGERVYGIYNYDYTIRSFLYLLHPHLGTNLFDFQTSTVDILPTLLDFFEISQDKNKSEIQGESLLPFIQQKDASYNKKVAYCETGGLYGPWPSPDKPNVFSVRTKEWKLIYNSTPSTWELYNLLTDPSETVNLAYDDLQIFDILKRELEKIQDTF